MGDEGGIRLTAQSVDISLCQNSVGCTTSTLIQQHETVSFELTLYQPELVKQVNVAHSAKIRIWDISIAIMARLRAGRLGNRSSIPGKASSPTLESTHPHIQRTSAVLYAEVNWSECKSELTLPSIVVVKSVMIYTFSTPRPLPRPSSSWRGAQLISLATLFSTFLLK